MKKLLKLWRNIDDNLVHIFFIGFIAAASLLPKLPLQHVEYTYIKIRFDDLLPAIVGIVFLLQWIRRKIKLNTSMLIAFLLFWAFVFVSFYYGYVQLGTIPGPRFNIGLLHSLRRIQYMMIFFVASSAIITEKRFKDYLNYYFITLFVVVIYAIGQKFLGFCSYQSMNPAYVDGRCLVLHIGDRINSTFGGHFDLAAYLTFSIPMIIGMYFATGKKRYTALFVAALIVLLYTSARSSFVAYLMATGLFLLVHRKFKYLLFMILATGALLFVTGDMTKRFQQTFQIKTVFVNTTTGGTKIDQKISVDNLPAGNSEVPLLNNALGTKLKNSKLTSAEEIEKQNYALEQVISDANKKGLKLTQAQIEQQANEIAKFIQPKKSVLCDISCGTRLQIEWPRAIVAFRSSPWLGTGPSSLTEATDNDILRWLGEFGVLGTGVFVYILVMVCVKAKKLMKHVAQNDRYIFSGFIFGTIALVLNGIYIDVFEASKVAYNFWLVAGMIVGLSTLYEKRKNSKIKA
jgi:hypothetical protein